MTGIPDPAILSEVALFRDLHSDQLSKLAARLPQRTFPSAKDSNTAKVPDSPIDEGSSGSESSSGWNDLVGWIEEQGEEDTQGFAFKRG
jgi:hypothetical protein